MHVEHFVALVAEVTGAIEGLPVDKALEAELNRRLATHEDFAFLYIDIDNFKGYNDTYGYAKGDEAIRMLAGILTDGDVRRVFSRAGHGSGTVADILATPVSEIMTADPSSIRSDDLAYDALKKMENHQPRPIMVLPVLDSLDEFPEAYERRLRSTAYEPAFDLNAALEEARQLTGRRDPGAYLNERDLLLGAMP